MSGDEFLALLDEIQKAAIEASIPHVVPMRTKDDALAAHRLKNGERSGAVGDIPPVRDDPALQQKATAVARGLLDNAARKGPITDWDKKTIRERYAQAKIGRVRVERGWVKRIAAEYNVSESYIYNIVYSDPNYKAI